ncbi:HAMP domain-containing histidine kinase [Pseudonocardia sp. DSM 110487]|uniref:sensor histidine kinase n=1 Tax=Pseudonocardia sp. DSM 110487 TaxID=2865833 RepID=UPI001C6A64AE|nr:HAMP domain-containing sensor histidine kinase [Pseudonocardia sp. DSM 110487]QYN40892.1 HAMP domain-containing histidine kinase [Pseudonocardia sp. DSM 110487]
MGRRPGLRVRLKLTLSYAGFLILAGVLLLGAVWMFLLRGTRGGAIGTLDRLLPDLSVFLLSGFGPRAFVPAAAVVMAFLLVFGLVGGWILAGSMLAPLTRITNATRMAASGSLSHRIRLPGRGDEFRELADAFDTMLAQLEAHVAEQRRFAANASHELRTPLAISQALLDVARTDPDRDTGELVDRLHTVNTRAIDLTEALLLLSRADRRSFDREHVDLSLVAEEAAETLLPLAEKRGVAIQTCGDITPTSGSRALLLQLATNLVHNAIVHNLPEQGTVWVSTSVRPENVLLTVENTGERLAQERVSTFAEPFHRGTERIHADHAGVGLGLTIVQSITQAHDGTLTLTPRAGGGLRVTVQLPGAPPNTGRSRSRSRHEPYPTQGGPERSVTP